MRTIFCGSDEFAVEALRALAGSPHRPAMVVTPPDRPRGRGRKLASPPAADAARALGLELMQSGDVNSEDALAAISTARPDAFAICEFGQLIKEPLLAMAPMLNVHPSLLPRWRGAAPIERALMAGDSETGMTIFQLVEALDAGPIALRKSEPILATDTYGALASRLARLGGELLVEALDLLEAEALELSEQPQEGVTYADKIAAEERRLDPARAVVELERIVRALTPHVGTYVQLADGERLGVERAAVADREAPRGELYAFDGRLLIGCETGTLELIEVKPAGKQAMTASDYLRGRREPPRLER
ncbi:MAG: methionyl-tRNA formyltransferase [Solirubrobacterales bacterium]